MSKERKTDRCLPPACVPVCHCAFSNSSFYLTMSYLNGNIIVCVYYQRQGPTEGTAGLLREIVPPRNILTITSIPF